MRKTLIKKNVRVIVFLLLTTSLLFVGLVNIPTTTAQASYNYGEALQKAIYFYMQQRSGDLPDDNPVIWRADSCLKDGSDVGKDLTGGYFDAGDHVKFGLPMAYTVAQLGWAVYEYGSAFQSAGQLDEVKDAIKWGADYFVKCHTAPTEFYYQVGSGSADHAWWGPAEVVEEVMTRPSYKVTATSPGSTVVAETAAALAVAYKVLGNSTYLTHAKQLFDFAYSTQSDSGYTAANGYYDSWSGFWDELSWAATWLYIATGNSTYLTLAEDCAANWGKEGRTTYWAWKWAHSWDDVHYGAQILLAKLTGKQIYIDSINRNFAYWIPAYANAYGSTIPGYDGSSIKYTPGGLAWLDSWGSLRYAATAAFLAFVWSDYITDATQKSILRSFAESQVNYTLGSNPRGGSYMCGFGTNSPRNPHHRTSHGAWYNDINAPPNNVHTLFGALVGGPDSKDAWADDRTDYTKNEVACDYNAGFVGALAKMYSLYGGNPLSDFPQNYFGASYELYRDEYFVRGRLLSDGATSTKIATQTTNRAAWPATVKDKLSIRYFFDLTELLDAGYDVSSVTVSVGTNEGATVSGPFHWGLNIYYIQINFTGTKIFPGGRAQCEKEVDITLSAPVWNSANDWSRQGLVANPFTYEPVDETGKTKYIPVYDNGVLIWGEEPPGQGQPPPSGGVMHVASIDMALVKTGTKYYAKATVTVVDSNNKPVSGATVYGHWEGATTDSDSGVTDASGKVTVQSNTVNRPKSGTTFTFVVDNIAKTGWTYNPAANVETRDSITVP
jgi:hypothetical protein